MLRYITRFICFIAFLYPVVINAQLYAPDADYSEQVTYDTPGSTDSIYIFNVPRFGNSVNVTIEALSPDNTDGWEFLWSFYNSNTAHFIPVDTVTGSSSAIDTISTSAGYQVIISKEEISDTFRAWVFINDFNVEITTRDDSGKVPSIYFSCEFLDLEAEVAGTNLIYYVPGRIDTVIYVYNSYSDINWTVENESGSGSKPRPELDPRITDLPYEDTKYIITVRDRFNLERSDTVLYESIQSRAEFDKTYIKLTDREYYPEQYGLFYGENYDYISAPAKYKFYNTNSKNTATYIIKFGNGDDTTFYNSDDTIIYEYIYPGDYNITFITKSEKPYECIDSSNTEITIDEPSMGTYSAGEEGNEPPLLPNVFTPNEDGFGDVLRLYQEGDGGNSADISANNLFRSSDVSVYEIDIVIFNRYGNKVHEYHGNIRDWKGWDGKIMGSDRNASEGVYFYVIRRIIAVEDWEDKKLKKYNKELYSGFVHLYREAGD
jgi:hypothetical protein